MPSKQQSPRILIVEDETIIARDIWQQLLAMQYVPVGHATTGEEAIVLAESLRPDLVLMDIQLGSKMDGIAAADAIRRQFSLPVVFLTSFATDEVVARALPSEPFGYVLKPIYERELRIVIEVALYRHQSEEKLRASEFRWKFALEGSGDGLWDWDIPNNTVFLNARWRDMLGLADAADHISFEDWQDFLHPEDRESVALAMQALQDGDSQLFQQEHRVRCRDGNWKWVLDRGMVVSRTAVGKPLRMIGTFSDITTRVVESQRLAAAYAQVRNLETALDEHAIVAITDRFGTITHVNDKFCAISQYSRNELLGQTHKLINSGHHPASFIADLWHTISLGGVWKGELKNRAKDGSYYWVDTTLVPFPDASGNAHEYYAIRRDITKQKELELTLRHTADQLRDLSTHQMSLKEEIRKNIAREIHDDLGGQLNGIKSYLSVMIGRANRDGVEVEPLLAEVAKITDQAIDTVRNMITELRPSVLDQLGVWAALQWYAQQIAARTELRCECVIDETLVDIILDANASTAVFRIVQELISNVLRHAGAQAVDIRATCIDGTIVVAVEDDGIGFDATHMLHENSWGIIGMYERALQINGQLSITRRLPHGTCAILRLPMESPHART